jgi:hypothetical protein
MRALAFAAILLLPACATGESPELACQKRLAAARDAQATPGDDFNHRTYAALDRTGCTAKQLAALDRIIALTRDLPGLSEANNRIGQSGDEQAHMAAFQKMNDAVITLNELEQAIRADLAQMEQAQ